MLQNQSVQAEWAQRMLDSYAAILDTETTGLDNKAQVIQLSILSVTGDILFDSLVRPTVPISPSAFAVHGINESNIRNAPRLPDIVNQVRDILSPVPVIIYNAPFDLRILNQSLRAYSLPTDWVNRLEYHCAMRRYTDFKQEDKWIKLPKGDHSALGDCRATLKIILEMAQDGASVPVGQLGMF